jgi:multidrug efflux pump subunit AcrB
MSRPVTLGVILTALGVFGAAALLQLPVELMPNVAYGNVTVFIDVRGGMPPPEVERLVTKPVEEAMGSVAHLRNIFSSSKKDRSVVTLEFEPGTNMDLAGLEVREKFLRVKHRLPSEIEKPIIARYEESDAPVLIAALTSDHLTPGRITPICGRGPQRPIAPRGRRGQRGGGRRAGTERSWWTWTEGNWRPWACPSNAPWPSWNKTT